MAKIQTALVSVSDKSGIAEFAGRLAALGIRILSTGGTGRLLREHGLDVEDVSEYTGFPEMLDGRIKTQHPKIHAGVLAKRERDTHLFQLAEQGIQTIDMVVVNLYPFVDIIAEPGVEPAQAIDHIDIGGPSLIRAAAKNHTHVAVVTNPQMYETIAEELEAGGGALSQQTHFDLAVEAFRHTAHYDTVIAEYLAGIYGARETVTPERLTLEFVKKANLRYGENPHQQGAFYVEEHLEEPCVANAERVAGPELSFNNVADLDAGIELIKEFDRPAAVVIKHANPCGAATAEGIRAAYQKAYLGDPWSAYGGIVVLNRPLDVQTARALAELRGEEDGARIPYFVEVLAAPGFEPEALELLRRKVRWADRIRMLRWGPFEREDVDQTAQDLRRVTGGLLVQDRDLAGFEPDALTVAGEREPTDEQMADLRFAWLCCKHARSNAAVVAASGALVGLGAGQVSRVGAVDVAVNKAGERAEGAVLASDGFFPFADCVERAAEAGVKALIQPGGSKKDGEVIAAADRLGMAMVLSGTRHFRH